MIERLLEKEKRFGEPDYSRAMQEILAASEKLSKYLQPEGKRLLDELSDAYTRRETTVMEAAFREGFCQATLLALDVLIYQAELPED